MLKLGPESGSSQLVQGAKMIVDKVTLDNVDKFIDDIEEKPLVPAVDESKVWERV